MASDRCQGCVAPLGLTLTDRATLVGLKVQVKGKSEGLTE